MEKTNENVFRIAIVGPESTGKTTLAIELADYYKTVYVPEYAREYIAALKRPYTLDDIVAISKGQMESEAQAASSANRLLLCDTNLVVTKIWAEHVFQKCPDWLINNLQFTIHHYRLHLLTYPDTPWTPDPQREHPHLREYLFEKYVEELQQLKVNYAIIKGIGDKRKETAIKAIERITNCREALAVGEGADKP